MTVRLETKAGKLRILDQAGELPAGTKSTLRLKGFKREGDNFSSKEEDKGDLVTWTVDMLERSNIGYAIDDRTKTILQEREFASEGLGRSRARGSEIKNGNRIDEEIEEFVAFLGTALKRRLLEHQVKAAIHMVELPHAANFSVPGAGKTAVVLAAYEFLRTRGRLNALFVVGPRSCFEPWRSEFEETLGRKARTEILAGGDLADRRRKYYPIDGKRAELYLTTYHTLARDKELVQHLIQARGMRVFFVMDEGHYMKQDDGVWANAVAATSRHAKKRCVLTGTPFPKDYADGVNLFDVLYPNSGLFDARTKARIRQASTVRRHDRARALLEPAISSLYFRVRKSELNLSKPNFLPSILVPMNPIERELYDCIEERIGKLEDQASDQDLETIIRLKRGRQIRRRQATSYTALLKSAVEGYHEQLIDPDNRDLNEKIRDYPALETPGKLEVLLDELFKLKIQGEKVVIWANFVGTLHRIEDECRRRGMQSKVVYGGTPTEEGKDEDSRETIIETFKARNSGLDILIANPAACAESVSLHKTCSNAIYYDLSYNCAEYLQSLDRIHRVGGSETKTSYYRFLQYEDTFEHEILENLREKASRMADVIDQDFPLALCELQDIGIDEARVLG